VFVPPRRARRPWDVAFARLAVLSATPDDRLVQSRSGHTNMSSRPCPVPGLGEDQRQLVSAVHNEFSRKKGES
jgi:hypothetical protein